jgi:hypothetical protein
MASAFTVPNPRRHPPSSLTLLASTPIAKARLSRKKTRKEVTLQAFVSFFLHTPCSRHNPKILGVDDAEIVGDRITEVRPIPRNFFTQETERRIGELGAYCPHLNPIERLWGVMHKHVTHNKSYATCQGGQVGAVNGRQKAGANHAP